MKWITVANVWNVLYNFPEFLIRAAQQCFNRNLMFQSINERSINEFNLRYTWS